MTMPFLGEIQIFGFNFPPASWAFANGATLLIQQNAALYSLIGTTYGGNGSSTYQLPNLVGRAPVNQGQGPALTNRVIGETFGEFTVPLTINEMPLHSHTLTPSSAPAGATQTLTPKTGSGVSKFLPDLYVTNNPTPNATLAPTAVGPMGSNTPHANQQPYLAMNICMALSGAYPSFA